MSAFTPNRFSLAALLTALACSFLFSAPALATARVEIKRMVMDEAARSRVPVALALAVAKVESDFNARALSHAGARGVMQIMPATGRNEFGLTAEQLWNPRTNIRTGLRFLEQLHDQYGQRWDLALSHYNGGTLKGQGRNAKAHGFTSKYVASVFRWRDVYSEQAALWQQPTPVQTSPATNKHAPDEQEGARETAIETLRAELQRREENAYFDERPEPLGRPLFREYYDDDDADETEADEYAFSDQPETRTAMIDEDRDWQAQRWHDQDAPILRRPRYLPSDSLYETGKFRRPHPVFRRHPGRRSPWN